jgi:putative transcriptional regulator
VNASYRGQLLVASPSLEDPNFVRTVVLLVAHGEEEGALGVVLNRPTGAEVGEILAIWQPLALPPAEVFRGGPVFVDAAICLARPTPGVSVDGVEGLEPTVAGLMSVDLERGPDAYEGAIAGIRVFTGYAGWSAGQLEAELEIGGWILTDAFEDPLTAEPDELWAAVLRRQGGLRAAYSNAPPKLSLN